MCTRYVPSLRKSKKVDRCDCDYQDHPSIRAFVAYILLKSASNMPLLASLQTLLGPEGLQSENHVGFILSERLVNMPVQVVPPMYRMLADEIKWAIDEVRGIIS